MFLSEAFVVVVDVVAVVIVADVVYSDMETFIFFYSIFWLFKVSNSYSLFFQFSNRMYFVT